MADRVFNLAAEEAVSQEEMYRAIYQTLRMPYYPVSSRYQDLRSLGYEFLFPDFAAGLAKTAQWYKKMRWLP